MQSDKIQAIKDWPELKDKKQVLQFMGLANYYMKFVHNFATLAAPLTDLLKKDTPFVFSDEWRLKIFSRLCVSARAFCLCWAAKMFAFALVIAVSNFSTKSRASGTRERCLFCCARWSVMGVLGCCPLFRKNGLCENLYSFWSHEWRSIQYLKVTDQVL